MQQQIMPSGGCGNCGKYEGEIDSILRKRLVRAHDSWLCRECKKEYDEEYGE